MNPYLDWIHQTVRLRELGRSLPLGGLPDCPPTEMPAEAPCALLFSPHPDDECIIGGLALRLLRESRWRIVNVAVTQGSRKDRQTARLEELRRACRFLQFELRTTASGGLEKIRPQTRTDTPLEWQKAVEVISSVLLECRPKAIFCPHELDWNSTHIGTHHLVLDALSTLSPEFTCHVVETEFWGQMPTPNLMVESKPEDVADLVAACSFHVGEVQRNPYHLSQTAWMQDNVRRGGELVGGQGEAPPDYLFATLYRLRRWEARRLIFGFEGGRNLSADTPPESLFA